MSILPQENESAFFSDALGQQLVKRTIPYLFAREDQTAWQTLESDVRKHYRSQKGPEYLKREIAKVLKDNPY